MKGRHERYQEGLRAQNEYKALPTKDVEDLVVSPNLDPDEIADRAVRIANERIGQDRQTASYPIIPALPRSDRDGGEDFRATMSETTRRVDHSRASNTDSWTKSSTSRLTQLAYPTVPVLTQSRRFYQDPSAIKAPERPPKEPIIRPSPQPSLRPPPLPSIVLEPTCPLPASSPSPSTELVPFPTPSHTEKHQPLRTLFLPNVLQSIFLACSQQSTALNLETCGILVGLSSRMLCS